MNKTPRSLRLHIGIFGKTNVGKSALMNALIGQDFVIVSEKAGTTTDPVGKTFELLPLGPVVFVDTAGIDDKQDIGKLRVKKTLKVFDKTDIAILVVSENKWTEYDDFLIEEFNKRGIPFVIAYNKQDLVPIEGKFKELLSSKTKHLAIISAKEKIGIDDLKKLLQKIAPKDYFSSTILGDLINPSDIVVLVVPIDKEAPKGRLILPQVQTIRDILDNDAYSFVVKERELKDALTLLAKKPKLVVTDSQAFLKVAADVPADIPLTSFSILFARLKGDLDTFVEGLIGIEKLKDGDKVLIAEACSHHPITDDIGTVKIPRWLKQYTGVDIKFEFSKGLDFPDNLSEFKLVIHCGGCMFNKAVIMNRIRRAKAEGVYITNYGLTIAHVLGIMPRALEVFPSAYEIYNEKIYPLI